MLKTAILGALIGDALGVPHEFKGAAEIPAAPAIQMVMPPTYQKTYREIPYGTWSDDGSQLLCLARALREGQLDLHQFGELLIAWRYHGLYQAGGVVFDCGLATDTALEKRQNAIAPHLCGGTDVRSNGNGSLMRVLPAAFVRNGIRVAREQSLLTHAHPISQACCAIYVAIAQGLLEKRDLEVAVNHSFRTVSNAAPDLAEAVAEIRQFGEKELPTGAGYVVNTLWSAIWALRRGHDFVECVQQAVSLGNDTDTTACVTGGLAAILHGLDSVPADWMAAMWDLHLVEDALGGRDPGGCSPVQITSKLQGNITL